MHRYRRIIALALVVMATLVTAASSPLRAQAPTAESTFQKVLLTAGRSTVVTTDFDITRIAITNPAVADATVVAPHEILVDGKGAGTISMIVWGAASRVQYDVVVEPSVLTIEQRLRAIFPGEDISVSANDEALILTGHVSSTDIALRAAEIAGATSSKTHVVNLLQYPGGDQSQQVMLQVRFAEVSRTALTELGASFFTGADGIANTVGRTSTERFAAPSLDNNTLTFSDYLNIFLFNSKLNLGTVLRALDTHGLIQSLAEPNLIAYNNQEASFLAGGEIPVPVAQGVTGTVTIQWKEYGIRLNFKPTIAGETIRLKVKPEVSTLDFTNGVTFAGTRIPALSTRRAETDVELRDGQSFAIAGLLNNLSQDITDAVPGLSKLPILGPLFKSKQNSASRNELMVLITPRLVRPLNPDEVPALPISEDRFILSNEVSQQIEGGAGAVDSPVLAGTTAQKTDKKGR
ncbi:MAG: type II and III secretion system protein family protein [Acidobacteriaceae bacterium]|jgi:pilus assembly protein CpaC|nr:type II and III secretion system protein family protein [Acidobacteriaceae bacterium]